MMIDMYLGFFFTLIYSEKCVDYMITSVVDPKPYMYLGCRGIYYYYIVRTARERETAGIPIELKARD